MDKLAAIQAFVRVVDAGSFVKAADHLGISTTSASRLVADLEAALGTRLLQRTTRRLSLTAVGGAYFARAQQILEALDDADALAGVEATRPSGHLHVSAPVAFGTRHLPPLLAEFHQRYPEVRVDISLADRVVDLVEEGFDVALRIAARLADTLVARRLCTIRMVVCAAPRYLAAHRTPHAPADLRDHDCLLYTLTQPPTEWRFDGPRGAVSVSVDGSLRSNNGELLRHAALAGEGIVLLPTFMVGDDLRDGRLVLLLPRYRQAPLTAHAVYLTRRHLPAKVRVFVDFCAERLVDPPRWDAWMSKPKQVAARGRAGD
jgi:DNA-binding transcriptional LysR family regulator